MNNFAKYGRVCPVVCIVLALAIQLGIMIPYFGLAGIASNYNEKYETEYKALNVFGNIGAADFTGIVDLSGVTDVMDSISLAAEPAPAEIHEWYDQCGFSPVDWVTEGKADETSTGWTTAFKYNAIIYMILMIITALMLCCMIIPGVPPTAVTGATGCIVCFGTPLLAGAILSAVRLNSELGTACNKNTTGISYLDTDGVGTTFAMNGDMMKLLFIVQFVFLCPMQCCAICGGGIGTMVLTAAKMGDDNYRAM